MRTLSCCRYQQGPSSQTQQHLATHRIHRKSLYARTMRREQNANHLQLVSPWVQMKHLFTCQRHMSAMRGEGNAACPANCQIQLRRCASQNSSVTCSGARCRSHCDGYMSKSLQRFAGEMKTLHTLVPTQTTSKGDSPASQHYDGHADGGETGIVQVFCK